MKSNRMIPGEVEAEFGGIRAPVISLDLLPYLTSMTRESPHKSLFWRYGSQMAVRAGDWKLTKAIDRHARPPAVKTGLFHIVKDTGEENDLAAAHPEKVLELQKLWDEWNGKNEEPLWGDEPTKLKK